MSILLTSKRFSSKSPRATFLPFSPPTIGEEEIAEVIDTLRSSWLSTGPKTQAFEKAVAAVVGGSEGLAVNSCTAALHLALVASGVGRGAQVITTPWTFAASVNVIEHVGAKPVMVDVEPDTLNIDPAQIAEAVTSETRAIIPVHFAGHPVDLDAIYSIAQQRSLEVIEDAAHALGATYKGRIIGSRNNPVAFSFYATKNLTTGEGGFLTGSPEFVAKARTLSLHGMNRDAWKRYDRSGSWFYEIVAPGFKYNMPDILASIGLQQLRKLPEFQKRRREIAMQYSAAFAAEPCLQVPVEREDVQHAWHLYVLRLQEDRLLIDRDSFIREMAARNIASSVHFIPVHLHPYYRDTYGYTPNHFPVAYSNFKRALSLPLHPGLTSEDVDDVIGAVTDVVRRHRR